MGDTDPRAKNAMLIGLSVWNWEPFQSPGARVSAVRDRNGGVTFYVTLLWKRGSKFTLN